jgi:hypothetical protein
MLSMGVLDVSPGVFYAPECVEGGFCKSPHTAFLYETASTNLLGSSQATFQIFEAGNVASFTISSGRHVPAPSVKLGSGSRRKEYVRMGLGDGSHYG